MRTPSLLLFVLLLCVGCTQTEPTRRSAGEADRQKSGERTDDIQAYLNETERLIRGGRSADYKEALDRCIWFHEHAMEHDPVLYGPLSIEALVYWKALGNVYPPARQALLDMRNRKAQQIRDGRGNASLFLEVDALNSTLGDNAETVRLFRHIDKTNGVLAAQCWTVARDAVLAEKQYDLAKKYLKAPLREYDRIKARYDYDVGEMRDDPQTYGAKFKQWTENHFVEECIRLIEAATAIDDKDAAQEIRRRAASVVDDPRLRETTTLDKGTTKAAEPSSSF